MRATKPEKRLPGRPPREISGHMVRVRIDRPVWEALAAVARERGTTASAVLRDCAERCVNRRGGPRAPAQRGGKRAGRRPPGAGW